MDWGLRTFLGSWGPRLIVSCLISGAKLVFLFKLRTLGMKTLFQSFLTGIICFFASLVDKGILRRTEEGGRSTNYELIEE